MSRWLTIRGWNLANWPLTSTAIHTTALLTRPSLLISSRFYSSPPILHDSWPKWLTLHPTSVEDLQTVYKVCKESRVFASDTQQPITHVGQAPSGGVSEHSDPEYAHRVIKTFRETPGLQHEDWEARGIPFIHAVAIAMQLHTCHNFSDQDAFQRLVESWPRLVTQIEAKHKLAKPAKTIAEQRQALNAASDARKAALKDEGEQIRQGVNLAFKARQALRTRKMAELESDAAEGIKSKRRPLRLAATSRGVPLAFETMKNLRRVERGGREIIVDKEVKKRTREAGMDRKPVRYSKDEPTRRHDTTSKHDHKDDHPPKEKRSEHALAKIKKLAEKSSVILTAIIEQKQRAIEQPDLAPKKKKNAQRQLSRAQQALAAKEWDARRAKGTSRVAGADTRSG